jgi:hypothetical protein
VEGVKAKLLKKSTSDQSLSFTFISNSLVTLFAERKENNRPRPPVARTTSYSIPGVADPAIGAADVMS